MIMSPEHPEWAEFRRLLRERVFTGRDKKCPGITDKPLSRQIIKKHFPDVDIPATLEFFKSRGGYCDCEVLLNVI